MENGSDQKGLLEALHAYIIYCANVGIYAEVHWYLFKLMTLLPESGMAYLTNFVQSQINEYMAKDSVRSSNSDRQCFLSKLVEMRMASPETYTYEVIFTACLTNIGAGSDTTSLSLTAILYYLFTNADKLHKVRWRRTLRTVMMR